MLKKAVRKVYLTTIFTFDERVQAQERFVNAQVAIEWVEQVLKESVNSTGIVVEATEFRMVEE